jgi:thiazole synthase
LCNRNALGSPIGSGQGLNNLTNIQIIIENANVPVIVDAGIGTPSEATQAMELGADGVLLNTAVAQSKIQLKWLAYLSYEIRQVQAGRLAYLAGRMEKNIMQVQVLL